MSMELAWKSASKSDEKSLYVTEIDDEICDDEEYFDAIDPGTAMSCLVCNVEHFPANYVKGDKVNTYAVCRWHLGISKCVNCRKNLVGLGVIRDHRRLCRAPPKSEASSWAIPVAHTILDNFIFMKEACRPVIPIFYLYELVRCSK